MSPTRCPCQLWLFSVRWPRRKAPLPKAPSPTIGYLTRRPRRAVDHFRTVPQKQIPHSDFTATLTIILLITSFCRKVYDNIVLLGNRFLLKFVKSTWLWFKFEVSNDFVAIAWSPPGITLHLRKRKNKWIFRRPALTILLQANDVTTMWNRPRCIQSSHYGASLEWHW